MNNISKLLIKFNINIYKSFAGGGGLCYNCNVSYYAEVCVRPCVHARFNAAFGVVDTCRVLLSTGEKD